MGNNMSRPSASTDLECMTFAAATLFTGILGFRNLNPPNPVKLDGGVRDTISNPHSFWMLGAFRTTLLLTSLWQALVCLSKDPNASPFIPHLPHRAGLDPRFFKWNPMSTSLLLLIWLGGLLRLRAMGELGKNFTFDLKQPDKLSTGGIYRFVQHPSYSAGIINMVGTAAWFMRMDGIWGAIMPDWANRWTNHGNILCVAIAASVIAWALYVRVRDEEEMLRQHFGKEWEEWHMRTPRIPLESVYGNPSLFHLYTFSPFLQGQHTLNRRHNDLLASAFNMYEGPPQFGFPFKLSTPRAARIERSTVDKGNSARDKFGRTSEDRRRLFKDVFQNAVLEVSNESNKRRDPPSTIQGEPLITFNDSECSSVGGDSATAEFSSSDSTHNASPTTSCSTLATARSQDLMDLDVDVISRSSDVSRSGTLPPGLASPRRPRHQNVHYRHAQTRRFHPYSNPKSTYIDWDHTPLPESVTTIEAGPTGFVNCRGRKRSSYCSACMDIHREMRATLALQKKVEEDLAEIEIASHSGTADNNEIDVVGSIYVGEDLMDLD